MTRKYCSTVFAALFSGFPETFFILYRRLVGSTGRAADFCAGGQGFDPQTGPTLRVLK